MDTHKITGLWCNGGMADSKPVGQGSIPWWLAEIAYERYCERYGRYTQSLECIVERGGFGRGELVSLLRNE